MDLVSPPMLEDEDEDMLPELELGDEAAPMLPLAAGEDLLVAPEPVPVVAAEPVEPPVWAMATPMARVAAMAMRVLFIRGISWFRLGWGRREATRPPVNAWGAKWFV